MSKERELLRKALHVLTSSKVWGGQEYTYLPIHPCQYKGISAEIKELLAQPEPFKPDWANYRQGVEDGINQAKNTQPEQEPVALVGTAKVCIICKTTETWDEGYQEYRCKCIPY